MPFTIIRNDITNMKVDAIVNTANPKPVVGAGTDSRIHHRAGEKLLEVRKKIGNIETGQAVITPGFDLKAKYVIHTVGPVWVDGNHNEEMYLKQCYSNSLKIAEQEGCKSIAFPMISTGTYGFPKDKALGLAMSTISNFLLSSEMMVYLVVFDKTSFALSEKLFADVESYINDNYVDAAHEEEYYGGSVSRLREEFEMRRMLGMEIEYSRQIQSEFDDIEDADDDWIVQGIDSVSEKYTTPPPELASIGKPRSLEDIMSQIGETFSESLMRLIDERGFTDPEVYKRANVSRKLFNKIKNNPNYQPSKETAISFAIALKLNLDEACDFIGKAGFALSSSSRFDLIIQYFLETENYDMFEINSVLFQFEQKTLGV